MKITILALSVLLAASTLQARSTDLNPDRYPSLGVDLIKAQQAGILRAGTDGVQTDGGLVGAKVDYKLPFTNALTWHAAAEALGINNNKDYTEGYRLEMGLRVYFIP